MDKCNRLVQLTIVNNYISEMKNNEIVHLIKKNGDRQRQIVFFFFFLLHRSKDFKFLNYLIINFLILKNNSDWDKKLTENFLIILFFLFLSLIYN